VAAGAGEEGLTHQNSFLKMLIEVIFYKNVGHYFS
jgi:hypothetical protein